MINALIDLNFVVVTNYCQGWMLLSTGCRWWALSLSVPLLVSRRQRKGPNVHTMYAMTKRPPLHPSAKRLSSSPPFSLGSPPRLAILFVSHF